MIEYIRGKIAELNPAAVVLETGGGVAYLLNITLPTYTELQGQESAKLLVYESIREDAWTLYGFTGERERQLFTALISVSGVGANTARMILSSVPAAELEQVIAGGNHARLKAVKGIGAKTAQRIIVDLKDKIKPTGDVETAATAAVGGVAGETFDEALTALVILGYQRAAAQKALKKLFENNPALNVESAIRQALAML